VQMPRNFQSPTHQILRQLARDSQWSGKLESREPYWVQEPAVYYDVLQPISSALEIWETEYIHAMPDHEAIVEWYKGTGLRPYQEALDAAEQDQFLTQYLAQLKDAYPKQKDGQVLFPFLRIFFIARR
jgi:trans-aconitate 2-methyltransferase